MVGSGALVRSLMRRNDVDEYVLLIHPLVLGSGRRLFTDGGAFAAPELANSDDDGQRRGEHDLPADTPARMN